MERHFSCTPSCNLNFREYTYVTLGRPLLIRGLIYQLIIQLTSLINNPKRKVLKSRITPYDLKKIPTIGELKTFHNVGALTDDMKQKTISKLQTEIYSLLLDDWNFTVGFKDTHHDPWNGTSMEGECAMGITNLHNGTLSVYLSYNIVMPLLRDDLSDVERMGCQWHIANTLLHEISVYKSFFSLHETSANY
jgi:hypothetical protein